MRFSEKDMDNFLEAVESLKKYRRADLIDDDGKNLLDTLYTDLLPNDFILKKCLRDNTTFLIGRKGTGKSTIFLKLEAEYRKRKNYLPCYIDVKTVYESSQSQSIDFQYLSEYLNHSVLKKYLIERTFIQNVLKQVQYEISSKTDTILHRITKQFVQTKSQIVKEKLVNLKQKIEDDEFLKEIEIPALKQSNIVKKDIVEKNDTKEFSIGHPEGSIAVNEKGLQASLKTKAGVELKNGEKDAMEIDTRFSEIFIKVFQIKDIILEIKEILQELEIKHLVILLDDLSEIDINAIKTFVDTIVAPLNNWSEEFVKFKIAVYPNRIHFGNIDPGKIDSINLDFYNLYSEFDRNKMEEYAVDFTQRLIEKRIKHYTKKALEYFFDVSKNPIYEYYELLFQVSMNVPRIVGYILSFCHQNKIIFDKQITKNDIETAAEKYYQDKIETFFYTNTYSLISIDEKVSILQLQELLAIITGKLVDIKNNISNKKLRGKYLSDSPYASHFYLDTGLEEYIRTLELNFFISKYDELSSRDGKHASIYCINYGLAVKNRLLWGKPKGTIYRKYFIERAFDFNRLIKDFLLNSKRIHCINPDCSKTFALEELPLLKFSNYKCNACGFPVITESISEDLKNRILQIDEGVLLPNEDITIILELSRDIKNYKYAKEIAEELDYSSHLVARRGKILDEKEKLIDRVKDGKLYKYGLTKKAIEKYLVQSDLA